MLWLEMNYSIFKCFNFTLLWTTKYITALEISNLKEKKQKRRLDEVKSITFTMWLKEHFNKTWYDTYTF